METKNKETVLKVSQAQIEVWEWKEKLSEELNRIPVGEQMKYIHEKTKGIRAELEAMRKAKETKIADLK